MTVGDIVALERKVAGALGAPPRRYASDPAACAIVKERLRAARVHFVVKHELGGVWCGAVADAKMGRSRIHITTPNANAESEEEAVCRFALACHEAGLMRGLD